MHFILGRGKGAGIHPAEGRSWQMHFALGAWRTGTFPLGGKLVENVAGSIFGVLVAGKVSLVVAITAAELVRVQSICESSSHRTF